MAERGSDYTFNDAICGVCLNAYKIHDFVVPAGVDDHSLLFAQYDPQHAVRLDWKTVRVLKDFIRVQYEAVAAVANRIKLVASKDELARFRLLA